MTRHVLDGYLTDTITIASIADDWRLATASTVIPVTAGAFGMVETEAASHNNFYIAGVIMSDKGASFSGDSSTITIADSAFIYARTGEGLRMDGTGQTLDNAGRIIAATDGILALGGGTINNAGLVKAGATGITLEAGSTFENGEKAHVIAADGILAQGNASLLVKTVNLGSIEATDAAYTGFAGTDWVINKGTMTGSVTLGGGADTFDNRGGTLTGSVAGGDGDDLYFVAQGSVQLVEAADQGIDEVRASSNFTLDSNFENLVLIGKESVNGTGNGLDNTITGNAGRNELTGKGGIDVLSGGAGNDVLTGGNDVDIFIFATGFGRDVITDFGTGADIIDLTGFKAINGFVDLMRHHVREQGGDVIFYSGDDQLVIRNAAIDDFRETDFSF